MRRTESIAGPMRRHWRPLLLVATVLGLALLVGPASARAIQPQTVPDIAPEVAIDDAVAFIDTLALTRHKANGITEAGWVRRWRGPVAVTLEGVAIRGLPEMLAVRLAHISAWTGLAFRLVERAESGDRIAIRILPHRALVEQYGANGNVCLTSTFGQAGWLHRATVDISDRYVDCLDHELMHALGFDNHWHGDGVTHPIASVLSPRRSPDRRSAFSAWDILAIRTLYNADMSPGLARGEAVARVRAILSERLVVPAAGK
jgi:hypothetical protein